MNEEIWTPEKGKLVVRQMVGRGVVDVYLGYLMATPAHRYSQIAWMSNFVSVSRFSSWHEAPAPKEYKLSEDRTAMRRYATDADLKAFVFLWSDSDRTVVEWFEQVIRSELGLLSSERDRLRHFVDEYQRAMVL